MNSSCVHGRLAGHPCVHCDPQVPAPLTEEQLVAMDALLAGVRFDGDCSLALLGSKNLRRLIAEVRASRARGAALQGGPSEGPMCRVCGSGVRMDPVEGEHATAMIHIGGNPLPCCIWCGRVKPRNGWRSKCPGRVRVTMRGGR